MVTGVACAAEVAATVVSGVTVPVSGGTIAVAMGVGAGKTCAAAVTTCGIAGTMAFATQAFSSAQGEGDSDSPMRPVNGESGAASDKSGTVDDTNVSDRGSKINPFKGKSFEQIDQELRDRGFVPKGKDPQSGKGSYMHPTTGRKYYLDKGGVYKKGTENPHVDVHYNRPVNGVEKQRLLLGDKLYDK